MHPIRIIGLVALVVGVILIIRQHQLSPVHGGLPKERNQIPVGLLSNRQRSACMRFVDVSHRIMGLKVIGR